jgi:hypothetical protein
VIEIVEPPDQPACSTCGALVWLWSPRREAWVCFVVQVERDLLRLHRCRHAQDYATWRELPHGDPPPAEYVEAREQLKAKNSIEE